MRTIPLALIFTFTSIVAIAAETSPPFLAQGVLAGEPGPRSILLQTRLTATPGLVEGEVPGTLGWVRFEVAERPDFANSRFTPWTEAVADHDFIVRTAVADLTPGRTYHYRAHAAANRTNPTVTATGTFRTLPGAASAAPVRFVVLTCMHYARFLGGMPNSPTRDLSAAERAKGYPALDVVRGLDPDFWISNGDNVYYDHPEATAARDVASMRRKWHEQAVLPRFRSLAAAAPAFYLKDDHDYRFDDADLTGTRLPSPADGIRIFREQVPLIAPSTPNAPTYRTVRLNRDLQLWFLEGRDYRSPNRDPDDASKSLWGAEQRDWLQASLRASDATFKIIVTPTPLVGPDDARKRDNHTNIGGFRHEGDAFFQWLKAERFDPNRLFLVTGDRHWKYHSIHPSGFQEWACGAIHLENARAGRAPGDPQSTDPEATIRQPHRDDKASGGFLVVEISSAEERPRLRFSLRNETGDAVYQQDYR